MNELRKMGITTCPHCKLEWDDRGFCGCEDPFPLNAIPQEKIDSLARTFYPRIVAYVEGLNKKSAVNKLYK